MEHSMYHVVLRTSALTLAFVLMFVSGLISPVTKELSQQTERYLASAVGMYAAVEPNGLNEVTAALTARDSELDAREAALAERELAIGLTDEAVSADYTTYILSVILFVLLVLIVTNYVLDFVRSRPRVVRQAYGQVA
jgi:hypothetical protein